MNGLLLHRREQLALEAAGSGPAEATTNHLAVEGMGKSDIQCVRVLDDADQTAALDTLDGVGPDQCRQGVQGKRFREGQQLQRVRLILGQLFDPRVKQRRELGGHRGAPAQLPDTAHLPKSACFQRALDKMPDVERVAARCRPHQIAGHALQPATERFLDQVQALPFAEWCQPQPFEVAVLPQRCDRVGHRLAVPDRRHDPHRPFQCQLMHQRRRRWSSRCASSTPMIECSALRIVSRAAAKPAIGSRDAAGPTRWAKTPNGIERADSVPATQCTGVGSDWVTARANVVLPTPASPNSTIPEKSCCPARAERMGPNSILPAHDRPGLGVHDQRLYRHSGEYPDTHYLSHSALTRRHLRTKPAGSPRSHWPGAHR